VISVIFSIGCSCFSNIEREDLVDLCEREEYVKEHPECRFRDNIICGEIVRGMESDEVMASWGMPNVYLISKSSDNEYWVYYVQDENLQSVLIYTLTFNNHNNLDDWDIDIKRFTGTSYVLSPTAREMPINHTQSAVKK